jgi:glycine hydroxymethyltransferase
MEVSMPDYLFRGSLAELDPELHEVSEIEAERQYRKLILIPSESAAPLAVREALSSAFQNIYAEGYPDEATRRLKEDEILDHEARLAYYRRYSDPRYYKGVEYADTIEALARRRCAEAFAANGVSADEIYVNVQALSGAPANNAIYHALVDPGETVMGMNLLHGGHLSHGSPVNRSGKYYNIVHYTVDPETEQIDYDAVEALALEHKPKMIIAGFSSYPWQADWARFRSIADSVGAYLLADIAHVAGLVAGGAYPSPIGIADVISSTTHKTLCGPRGAIILTTSRKLATKIDRAVFPGEQGGPHLATILAQALAFKLAATEQFSKLAKQIVANCIAMTAAIEKGGLRIPFGGTDTHLSNVDCKSVVGPDGTTLSGDLAARVLDLAGIVVNRNTIPGDHSAANPSGIRFGTPWITQRGFSEKECKELGTIIADVLKACTPYSIAGRKGKLQRTKIDFNALNEAKIKVRELATSVGIDFDPPSHGYPHFYYLDDPAPKAPYTLLELEGEDAEGLLRWASSARPAELKPGGAVRATLHTPKGSVETVLTRMKEPAKWQLAIASKEANPTLTWLRDLSDGYVGIDPDDLQRKFPGPVVVRLAGEAEAMPETDALADGADKPWYLGASGKGKALPKFEWTEPEEGEPSVTALNATHRELGAKMVPFAGWDMPVWYTSVIEEHLATRQTAGLFDVSHMGVYQFEGPHACAFLDSVVTNEVSALAVGQSLYAQFLDPDGKVIDDTMIYRRREEAYLVVVNASNDDKDWAWLTAVREGRVCIDNDRPWALAFGRECVMRNLRDPKEGADMRVDIALQGPKSRDILLALGCDEQTAAKLKMLHWAGIMEGIFGGFDLVVSRTGYTGERVAYELFIHPEKSVELWKAIMKVGEPFGLKPIGLGARDSLRTEAGLPLYGHEMAGDLGLTVGDAGFGAYVKPNKPWFIGRAAFVAQEAARKGELVRFRFNEKGVRMAHNGDPVVDGRGRVIGKVTSCAVESEGYLLGQAYLEKKYAVEGTQIAVFQSASDKAGKAPAKLKVGEKIAIPTPATVLSRFPR